MKPKPNWGWERKRFGADWHRGRPPPWWPEGAEWPPRGRWRHRHRRLFPQLILRLFAVFFLGLFLCGTSLFLAQAYTQGMTLISYLLLAGVVILLLIGVRAAVQSGSWLQRLTTPIEDILAATERLASGDYSARVREAGLPELQNLAASVNSMADQLQRASESRRGFFAKVTHELRTPLTVLQGDLEGMLDGITPRDDERIESLLEETRHLAHLIEDLRTLSLAEAGALDLRLEPVDLPQFVGEVAESFANEAERLAVRLIYENEPGSALANVDPHRLREVLANLVLNALQASSPSGQVTLGYAQEGPWHLLTVADNGPGIPEEVRDSLFERFNKSAASSGSGLGLAIARELVEAHGGKIEADSRTGEGTTLRIWLPRDLPAD